MTVSGYSIEEAVRHSSDAQLATWQARMWIAIAYFKTQVPGCGASKLHMIMRAATGYRSPAEKATGMRLVPHLGENARIDLERNLYSTLATASLVGMKTEKDKLICPVDDLNRALGWLMGAIEATDAEYTAIVNTVNSWVARDETQLGLHVERQREALEADRNIDIGAIEKEVDEQEEKKRERKQSTTGPS